MSSGSSSHDCSTRPRRSRHSRVGVRGIDAEHRHVAAGARPVTLEDLDRRGLARAVRPEKPEDLAGGDLEVDPAHRFDRAVSHAEVVNLDRGEPSRRQCYGRLRFGSTCGPYAGAAPVDGPGLRICACAAALLRLQGAFAIASLGSEGIEAPERESGAGEDAPCNSTNTSRTPDPTSTTTTSPSDPEQPIDRPLRFATRQPGVRPRRRDRSPARRRSPDRDRVLRRQPRRTRRLRRHARRALAERAALRAHRAGRARHRAGVRGRRARRRGRHLRGARAARSASRRSPRRRADWLDLARIAGVAGLRPLPPPPEEARLHGRRHSKDRDAAAIAHHYDVSNDFYRMVLGPSMTYSCGVWPSADATLETAQASKYELVSRKLGLEPGMRLLDVGCGWGGMVMHAARHHGVRRGRHHAVAAPSRVGPARRARRRSRRPRRDPRAGLPRRARRSVRRDQLDRHVRTRRRGAARRVLRDAVHAAASRVAACSTTASRARRRRGARPRFARRGFIDRYVFPDGELHEVGSVVSRIQNAGFEARHVEGLREHYALTLRAWVRNLEASWDRRGRRGRRGARARVAALHGRVGGELRGRDARRSTRCSRCATTTARAASRCVRIGSRHERRCRRRPATSPTARAIRPEITTSPVANDGARVRGSSGGRSFSGWIVPPDAMRVRDLARARSPDRAAGRADHSACFSRARARPARMTGDATSPSSVTPAALVQTRHGSVLCDPWFTPAYFGSWFPFPRNDGLDPDADLGAPDYLYISHLHRDHFDPRVARAQREQAGTRPAARSSASTCSQRELRALGFHDFVRTRHGERVDLDGLGVTILAMTSPADGPLGDSAIVLDDGTARVLNQNDARPGDLDALHALGPFDAQLLQFSGAIWYPDRLRLPAGGEGPARARRSGSTRWSAPQRYVEAVDADARVPVRRAALLPRPRPLRAQRPRPRSGQHLPRPDRVPRAARGARDRPRAPHRARLGRSTSTPASARSRTRPTPTRLRAVRRQARVPRAVPARLGGLARRRARRRGRGRATISSPSSRRGSSRCSSRRRSRRPASPATS